MSLPPAKIALAALGGGLFLAALAQGWQAIRAAVGLAPSAPGASKVDPSDPTLLPKPSTSANSHRAARPILIAAFEQVMGRKPTSTELQYLHAIAWLETNYGKGWSGAMVGSNNWGAVQCPANAQSGPDCIPYQDSQSSGQKYSISFRRYASPIDGAADVVRHVFKLRPITAASLAAGEPTFNSSYNMRRERYYGGFCPAATAKYGAAVANASFAHPDRDAGTEACEAEAVALHALRAHTIIQNVADALSEPVSVPMGAFPEADRRYKASHTVSAGVGVSGSQTFAAGGIVSITPGFGVGEIGHVRGVDHASALRLAGLQLHEAHTHEHEADSWT